MRTGRHGTRPVALLLLALLAAAPPTPQQLREAERNKAALLEAQRAATARAAAAQAEAQRLATQRVEVAARLRDLEDATAKAADKVQVLAARRQEAQARLMARSAELAPLLPVLERLSLYPAETLLAVPMPPERSVRGMLVLGGIARSLETDAAALRAEAAEVATRQAELDVAMSNLAAAQAAQAQAGLALDGEIAAAQTAWRSAQDAGTEAARKAATEAARANTIRSALARIEADRRAAEAEAAHNRQQEAAVELPRVPAPRGNLTTPVSGTVVRGFGEATDAGPATGLSYEAAPGARVVSPCAGRVVFAGPFRSFGLLLIVDCGGGYHFVLSGFDRLDAQVGQSVQGGEPVGLMPGWDPRASTGRPSLYVELRKDGQPVNPAPFLRAKTERSG